MLLLEIYVQYLSTIEYSKDRKKLCSMEPYNINNYNY